MINTVACNYRRVSGQRAVASSGCWQQLRGLPGVTRLLLSVCKLWPPQQQRPVIDVAILSAAGPARARRRLLSSVMNNSRITKRRPPPPPPRVSIVTAARPWHVRSDERPVDSFHAISASAVHHPTCVSTTGFQSAHLIASQHCHTGPGFRHRRVH